MFSTRGENQRYDHVIMNEMMNEVSYAMVYVDREPKRHPMNVDNLRQYGHDCHNLRRTCCYHHCEVGMQRGARLKSLSDPPSEGYR
jgi:hypothetical protein